MPQSSDSGKFYTQLSQAMTDSDSEGEEVRFKSLKPRSEARSVPNASFNATSSLSHPIRSLGTGAEEAYYLNYNPNSNGGHLDGDGVAMVNSSHQDEDEDSIPRKPMTLCRKVCFCASILVCILSVVIFLWVLPCSDDLTCSSGLDKLKTNNWMRDFEKIEFKGVISLTNGLKGRSKHLIFMYRGDKIFQEFDENHHRRNGIICMIGLGQVAWFDQMADEPSSIDCSLLDVDNNGYPDCLVIDEYGQLKCINPVSGQWMWHINLYQENHTEIKSRRKAIDLLDFPLVLPDVNGDGINDLLLVTSLEQVQHNNLLFVSGSNGRTIGKKVPISKCGFVHKLKLDEDFQLLFNCINNDTELLQTQSISELFQAAVGKELKMDRMNHPNNLDQHKFFGQRRNTQNQRNIFTVSGRQLIIENYGKCPQNCSMSITLADEQGVNKKRRFNDFVVKNGTNMYGMVPAVLRFEKKRKYPIHGFVVKYWEWSSSNSTSRKTRSTVPNSINSNLFSNSFEKKKTFKFPDEKPRISKREAINPEDAPKRQMRHLKETVVLIIFNSTETRIINTSQSEILQFCQDGGGIESFCQPDINFQENSLLISDLDNDGSQELVSFYSTFVENDSSESNATDPWKLVTYVQLLRLETELNKLYDPDG